MASELARAWCARLLRRLLAFAGVCPTSFAFFAGLRRFHLASVWLPVRGLARRRPNSPPDFSDIHFLGRRHENKNDAKPSWRNRLTDSPHESIEKLTPGTLQEFCSRLQSVDEKLNEILDRLVGAVKSHYGIAEVAALTARAPYTVRRWVAEGLLSATRVAGAGPRGRLLIPRAELQRLIGSGLGSGLPETVLASDSSK